MILLIKKNAQFLLLLLFSIFNLTVYSQESGILIKSTMKSFKGWNGSHSGSHTITVGSNMIIKDVNTTDQSVTEYDFFYVTDNPSEISCIGSTSGNKDDSNNCSTSKTIPYNKTSFDKDYFSGCIGSSKIYGIHLPEPDPKNNNRCINDIITFSQGWNWEYQYNADGWKPFPAEFQNNREITFKIKDLGGYEGKTTIHFQTGYKTQFTNTITYNIIPCPPALDPLHPPIAIGETCNKKEDGEITFTFDRPLAVGESFLFTRNPVGANATTSSKPADIEKISDLKYKWKKIAPGTYNFIYQTQFDNGKPSKEVQGSNFKIEPKPELKFTATPTQPLCSTGNGSITIAVSGGTSPYYYILDKKIETKKEITNPIELSAGNHNIKVEDKNGCVEKKP
jgi:hypothetical protein